MSRGGNSCSQGYGPDLMYRFPLEPLFTQPYGTDCGFSEVGFRVYGSVVLAVALVSLVIHLMTLPDEENRLFTYVRLMHCVHILSICTVIVIGFIDISKTYIGVAIFTIVFMNTALVWLYLGYRTVVRTVMNVQISKEINASMLLGGPCVAFAFIALLVITHLGTYISTVLIAVNLSQGNIEATSMAYRFNSAFIGASAAGFALVCYVALTRFLAIIDKSLTMQIWDDNNGAYQATLKDVRKRFHLIRNTFVAAATFAAISEFLQAIILPMFWYLQLGHELTTLVCGFGLLMTFTSPRKRELVKNRLLCRRIPKESGRVITFRTKSPRPQLIFNSMTDMNSYEEFQDRQPRGSPAQSQAKVAAMT